MAGVKAAVAKSRQKDGLTVIEMPIDRITPYPNNPRANAGAVEAVAASLREFGFQQPIVVDRDFTVIVGHTRLEAAKTLGLKKVPVHIARQLSPEQVRAYRLADNRTGENASWDKKRLGLELAEMAAAGMQMAMTGFLEPEWERLIRGSNTSLMPDADLDEAGPTPPKPTTKPGDRIELGIHRLVCGSATDPKAWDKLLGARFDCDLLWTDPPYNVSYEKKNRSLNRHDGQKRNTGAIAGDDTTTEALENSTKVGDRVVDCFAGSGTTLIAAEATGREAYLLELSPGYCDVIVDRWETVTGRKATRTR